MHSSPQFSLEGIKTFYNDEGKQISYRPTKPKDDSWVCSLQSVVENIDEPIPTKSSYLLKVDPPAPKNTIQSSKMKEGEYLCYQYASTTYRGKPKTILFLIATGTEEEIPTYGPFLQQEVEKLDLSNCIAPIYCRIGEFKHIKSRHKDRTFSIVASHVQLAQSQSPVQIQPTLDNKPDVARNVQSIKYVSKPVSRKIRADNISKKIYPETSVNKMLPGRYVFDTFHTKNNGRIRTYLHLQAIDATGKRAGFFDGYATYGKSIEKEIGKLDLQNTIAPVYCTITDGDGPGGREFQIL